MLPLAILSLCGLVTCLPGLAPSPRQTAEQPTGTLLRPLNGTLYDYTDNIKIQYQPIYIEDLTANLSLPQYFTDSINVALHGIEGQGDYVLATQLTTFKQGLGAEAAIEARFHHADLKIPPGYYELIIEENAIHYETLAPAVTVTPTHTINIVATSTPPTGPPSPRKRVAGPSGQVIIPSGGTTYEYLPGSINLVYQPATYYTSSIDVALYDISNDQTQTLAYGLTSSLFDYSPTLPIIGHWTTFERECGQYQLIITEHQSNGYGDDTVAPFRAAAPYVSVDCTTYNPPSRK